LPHNAAEWYIHLINKNLLKEYGLHHSVAEWYVCLVHKNLLKEHGLLHICLIYEDLLIKNGLLHTIHHMPDMLYGRREQETRQERLRRAEEKPEEREIRYSY